MNTRSIRFRLTVWYAGLLAGLLVLFGASVYIGLRHCLQNLEMSVKFKAVSGEVDRAAGMAFRLVDANNYYIVRANALEGNYRLYHVVKGRRVQFAGANVKVASGEWHELRVECTGNHITCYYDGEKKIDATDETFKEAGRVGLWTKADSVTYFDDLRITAK
jgi:hypothetical protein